MEVTKDMVNLIKNIVPEVMFEGDDMMVWSKMVDPSRIQLLYLEYQPRHLFPFDFPEKMAIDIDHLKIAEKVFSSFKMDYTGEFWIGDKPKGDIAFRNLPDSNPEIEMKFETPNPEDFFDITIPELDITANFSLYEKFDCKRNNVLIVRGDEVYLGDYELNSSLDGKVMNERRLTKERAENKYDLAYYLIHEPYKEKADRTCKAINEFISTFEVVNVGLGIEDYPMTMTGTKYYNMNGRKLTLTAKLITAPKVLNYLEL